MKNGDTVIVYDYKHRYFIVREITNKSLVLQSCGRDQIKITAEKKDVFAVNYGSFGNGLTIWIPNTEVDLAHISYERKVSYRDGMNSLDPRDVMAVRRFAELLARENESQASASQSQKVLSELSVQDKVVNRIIRLSHNVKLGETMRAAMIHEAFTHYGLKELDSEKFNHHSKLFMDNFMPVS